MPFMPMELCAPMVSDTELSCELRLAQHARVAGIRQAEAAVLLGDDEAEQPQIAQALNELGRLLGARGPSA